MLIGARTSAGRRTRTGAPSPRRVWRCGVCARQFSALTGSALHGTRLDPAHWITAARYADELDRVPTAPELARRLPVTREAAGRMARLFAAVQSVTGRTPSGSAPWLSSVVRLSAAEVGQVRRAARPRVRPSGRVGPSADLGG